MTSPAPPGHGSTPPPTFLKHSGKVDTTNVPTLPGQGEVIWEKPHNPHALHLPLMHGTLERGFIVQDKSDPATKANRHGRPLGLHFLYNPTEVDVSYTLNTSIYPTGAAPGSDVPLIGVPGAASVSWNLILDRTYDVQDPSDEGILEDVHHFERMMVYDAASPFIQPVAMFVVFGNTKMKFYGFIQGFDVVYTNWTQDMRPYRGGISGITMQVLPLDRGKKSKQFHLYDTLNKKGTKIRHRGGGSGRIPGYTRKGKVRFPTPVIGIEAKDAVVGVGLYTDGKGKHELGIVDHVYLGGTGFPPGLPNDDVEITFTHGKAVVVKKTKRVWQNS